MNGEPASGIKCFAPDPRTCGLFIESLSESQLGTWSCMLGQKGRPYHKAFLSVMSPGELVQGTIHYPYTMSAQFLDFVIPSPSFSTNSTTFYLLI